MERKKKNQYKNKIIILIFFIILILLCLCIRMTIKYEIKDVKNQINNLEKFSSKSSETSNIEISEPKVVGENKVKNENMLEIEEKELIQNEQSNNNFLKTLIDEQKTKGKDSKILSYLSFLNTSINGHTYTSNTNNLLLSIMDKLLNSNESVITQETMQPNLSEENTVICISHQYEEILNKEATCNEDGLRIWQCKVCGNRKYETIEKQLHTFVVELINEATTKDYGLEKHTCTKCGNTRIEVVEKLKTTDLEILRDNLLNQEIIITNLGLEMHFGTISILTDEKQLIQIEDLSKFDGNLETLNASIKNKITFNEKEYTITIDENKIITDVVENEEEMFNFGYAYCNEKINEGIIFEKDGTIWDFRLREKSLIEISEDIMYIIYQNKLYRKYEDNKFISYGNITENGYALNVPIENNLEKYECDLEIDRSKLHYCLEHSYIQITATCTSSGNKEYVCEICGNINYVELIDALGHDYVDEVCTRCGKIKEYVPIKYNEIYEYQGASETQSLILRDDGTGTVTPVYESYIVPYKLLNKTTEIDGVTYQIIAYNLDGVLGTAEGYIEKMFISLDGKKILVQIEDNYIEFNLKETN